MIAFLDPLRPALPSGGEGHGPVVAVLLASSRKNWPVAERA
jgi:hypothetical protein